MRLFVVGNISSGKSFLIEKIKKVLPEYEVLKIDDYRTNHCDGSLEAELKMWKDFPREIIKYCNVIVELSGGGEVTKNINELLKENSFLTIYVDTDVETCLERSKNKDFSKIPYPKEFSESIEEIIERLGKDFDKCIEEEWKKSINIIKVNSDIDVSSLPLRQYHELLKLSDTLKEIRGSLFSFGSTGRGEMSKSSDVDTFFLTKIPLEDLYGILSYNFDCVNIMGKEFVIRENGILLEVNCIEDINDARLFYNRSLITNPRKTILKDGYNIMNDLIKYSNEHINLDDEVDYIIERLDYYVESLPRIIEKRMTISIIFIII